MDLDNLEISGLKDILNELNENIAGYEKRKETGNSKGEHKDIYRGKFEAYSRCRTILYRYLKWHSIIEVASDGSYHFLKNGKLPIPHVSKSVCKHCGGSGELAGGLVGCHHCGNY